jgi:hypothetical protein
MRESTLMDFCGTPLMAKGGMVSEKEGKEKVSSAILLVYAFVLLLERRAKDLFSGLMFIYTERA